MIAPAMMDFSELHNEPPGEALENLVREIGARLGLSPRWTGRGADQGRDLIFLEQQLGPIGGRAVRWVVSCKDKAKSGKSVTESEVGSVVDKVKQHRAGGFLLVTTTTPGAALKEKLDSLDYANGGDIHVSVWDAHELSMKLLDKRFHDLVQLYLPNSYKRLNERGEKDAMVNLLLELLPQKLHESLKNASLEDLTRRTGVLGKNIWPYDQDMIALIDQVVAALVDSGDVNKAASLSSSFRYDEYEVFLNAMSEYYPGETREYAVKIIEILEDQEIKFNTFRFISETYEFSDKFEQCRLASYLDSDSLELLFDAEISSFVSNELILDGPSYSLWSDLDALSSNTIIEDVHVENFQFFVEKGVISIKYAADILIYASLYYDEDTSSNITLPGRIRGWFDPTGIFLESATVDTSRFYE